MAPPKSASPLLSEPVPQDDTAVWSLRHIQFLRSWTARPAPVPYPPISSIPHTSAARLSEPDVSPTPFPSEPVLAKAFHQDATAQPKTILYLAYGSNMCAKTFLGMRGIRPLSQVNVSAPSLDLTFDLPGRPYSEPCFANTALRKLPGKPPKLPPDLPNPPIKPPVTQDGEGEGAARPRRRDPVWNKGLYGVVYEVTTEDYARIVATEGGGAGYHDILVPCIVLPPSVRVPEKPTIPVPLKPFLAHTLYAPRLPETPDNDGEGNNNNNSGDNDNNPGGEHDRALPLPAWLRRLLRLQHRPSPNYAQPSARYLNLLRDGAREHDLPADYQAYLGALRAYTITTWRQRVGQVVFTVGWLPMMLLMVVAMRAFADERGRAPGWVVAAVTVLMNLIWLSYDLVGKRLFGDGERTMEEEKVKSGGMGKESMSGRGRRRSSFASGLRGKEEAADEEKVALLKDY
ncbi:uncharacterized protein THITE_2122376 [Thermothielavioides terrestris NRRL 8126]|uniref:gamma-glutamylcyclotransferase n=1 Tax=Thermothielavioides terrestris (strain ATCC 38088 / NRRL 8126) TaxID=578455 RepID=G2RD00_THETT|nr:uncharacterized protein THITE_2122376 [Thermothielavioides terrestris NRRL 8126]AEO70693.1 hypothetical protein THITE_2122376 [Thermothielavioides terrestris NRRL 8126]